MNPGIVLLAVVTLMQQGGTEKAAKEPFVSKTCGFSVAMPGPTTESFQTEQTPAGPLINKIFQYAGPETVYTVIAADYPGELQAGLRDVFLNGILLGYTTNAGGKLVSQKKITFLGEKAREVTLELQGGIMHSTYFIKDKRIYQILVFFADPKTDKPEVAKKFVDSFNLVKVDGKLTDGMENLTLWKDFRSKDGGYKIKMLGDPKETTQKLPTDGGEVEMKMITMLGPKNENYVVSYSPVAQTDPPQTLKVFYESVTESIAENIKGKILSRKAISHKGKPGSEALISLPATLPYEDGVFKVRMFIVKDRLYQFAYVGPKARLESKEIIEYFDSFELDDSLLK